jgi:hypothetical protein
LNIKKRGHMVLEIQILNWDRDKNVANLAELGLLVLLCTRQPCWDGDDVCFVLGNLAELGLLVLLCTRQPCWDGDDVCCKADIISISARLSSTKQTSSPSQQGCLVQSSTKNPNSARLPNTKLTLFCTRQPCWVGDDVSFVLGNLAELGMMSVLY